MSPRDDQSLVAACLGGDEGAWNELVERFGRLVYSIPRRYGMPDADADDVFQSVFTILYRRLGSLEDERKVSAWLITTTHRECWRINKRRDVPDADIDQHFESLAAPPEAASDTWETQHLVRRALGELGGRCERLLIALFIDAAERSYEQIADDLGMKVGSLGPTRARCFKKLEAILASLGVARPENSDSEPGI